jgi:hypothetical protein
MTITSIPLHLSPIYSIENYPAIDAAIYKLNDHILNRLQGSDACFTSGDDSYEFCVSYSITKGQLKIESVHGFENERGYKQEYRICFKPGYLELIYACQKYVFSRYECGSYYTFPDNENPHSILISGNGYYQVLPQKYDFNKDSSPYRKFIMTENEEAVAAKVIVRICDVITAGYTLKLLSPTK